MFGSLASECGKEKQSGEVINLERSCGQESQEHSHPGCGAGGHLARHPSLAPSRAAKFFRLPKPTKERNICCPRITPIDANHFTASASARASARISRSVSVPITFPSAPTMLAIKTVTWPPPQPASRHFIPWLSPTLSKSAEVVGNITRARRSRRCLPSLPQRIAYGRIVSGVLIRSLVVITTHQPRQ
jgi:hypothetical protein